MEDKVKKFKGHNERVWLALTATVLEANNAIMAMTHGDDEKYCNMMAFIHDVHVPLYVDSAKIDITLYNRFFQIFIYVIEFIYGDPYTKADNIIHRHYVTIDELFKIIKKNWDVDIDKKLEEAKKHIK